MQNSDAIPDQCKLHRGDRVGGKYIVDKTLGEGAFGQVFKVEDQNGIPYALKVLMLWKIEPDIRKRLVQRFDMEYETSRIKSNYLVHSTDKGFVNGNPYIVMEYCPGGDLISASESGLISDYSSIAQAILLGLRDLHKNGKVHRDLKPENVLIRADGSAALTDFGISGDRNKRMTERNIIGTPQEIFGTYAYMPPEQVNPKRGDATVLPTTDIYSFGVMMYQMLTYEMPFGQLVSQKDLVRYLEKSKKGLWNRNVLEQSQGGKGKQWVNVISGCLTPDYTKRLASAETVIKLLPKSSHSVKAQEPVIEEKSDFIETATHGYLLRIMQGEEYGRTIKLNSLIDDKRCLLTLGRQDNLIHNSIEILEDQSCYISRKHCTLEYNSAKNLWLLRDGQWDPSSPTRWKQSLNGSYVNSHEVTSDGYFLNIGDIVSIGDVKMRVEGY